MTKSKRVNNKDMGRMVTWREPFKNNNDTCYGQWRGNLYIVWSYGPHFPIYVWDEEACRWYGNSGKYSSTTSRHQSNARPNPLHGEIIWVETEQLLSVINSGGTAGFVAHRMSRDLEPVHA
jgi:hypothetical protein